jgi:hypothetical protein
VGPVNVSHRRWLRVNPPPRHLPLQGRVQVVEIVSNERQGRRKDDGSSSLVNGYHFPSFVNRKNSKIE